MANRLTVDLVRDAGRRTLVSLLVVALVASMMIVIGSAPPADAVSGETGPQPVPGTDTIGLRSTTGQWETKNQHRIWWNDAASRWDAILPAATVANGGPASADSQWWIGKGVIPNSVGGAPTWDTTAGAVDATTKNRPDAFWDAANDRLYVLLSGGATVFRVYNYSGGNYSLVAGTATPPLPNAGQGRAVIYKSQNGYLWAAVMTKAGLFVTNSTNDGTTWSPVTNLMLSVDEGQTVLANLGTTMVVAAAEDSRVPSEAGRYSEYLYYSIAESASTAVTRATGTLTLANQPAAGYSITIGGRTYTFDANGALTTAAGHVEIGATLPVTQANLVNAINGTGTPGVGYAANTNPHPSVTMSGFSVQPGDRHGQGLRPGGRERHCDVARGCGRLRCRHLDRWCLQLDVGDGGAQPQAHADHAHQRGHRPLGRRAERCDVGQRSLPGYRDAADASSRPTEQRFSGRRPSGGCLQAQLIRKAGRSTSSNTIRRARLGIANGQ